MSRITVIGLTGQTGAGKSTVSAVFARHGFAIINADLVARQVVEPGQKCLAEVFAAFGSDVQNPDGTLNRRALAGIVFNDKMQLEKLNAIMYPHITQQIQASIREAENAGKHFVLLDAPTLFESGADKFCRCIVSVTAPAELRLSRIMERDSIPEQAARERMNAQLTEEYFIAHSDHLINNDADLSALEQAAEDTVCQIMTTYSESKGSNHMEKEKSQAAELKEALFAEKKHAAQRMSDADTAECNAFCDKYMAFMNTAKTEREAMKFFTAELDAKGYQKFTPGMALKAGDKIYLNNRGKAVILATIGTAPITEGVRLCAAHIDSPRLDLKQNPLYESEEIGFFKTHYYGGIKKYQWTAIPLSLHGVIVRKDGEKVEVRIGEDEGDPVFYITDLLIHLATEQMKRPLAQGIKGEELNIVIGSLPFKDDKGSELVKLNLMKLLNEKYGIVESDFLSAELEAVPAFRASDVGFDRSLIGAYGHDDRVCSYPAFAAALDVPAPEHTSVVILTDKEETGSDGNTGLCSSYLKYFLMDLAECFGANGRHVMSASKCLSADVNAGFDPTFPEVLEKNNCAYINHGVCVTKFTGARGKSGTSDASAEFVGEIRLMLDKADVIWQTGELGKVDMGGGGTVAAYIANLDIDTIDIGVPVLSMHAPYELVAKADVWSAYRAFKVFLES